MPFDAPARQTVAWLVFAAWPLGLTAAACAPPVRPDGSLGFVAVGDPYDEDDITHIDMLRAAPAG